MHRTLIVAKLRNPDTRPIAETFAESDATELPHLVGVTRRTLFSFHDLYFHLVEAGQDISPNLYRARSHPLYQDVNTRLASLVAPYDPGWKEPKDAMATPFYVWTAEHGRVR
ncbi:MULTISPECIES: TcmI family type II polyketide cyclase [Amycolatopsis]|uniref:TcmI family type II polyketide cyclase n=1 Tax=Amycolatopsis TaxID=1813 RepID=UPI000B8B54A9|nr:MULTISPECIES: TcmI family type II polyketide cyclase [Amycolatopsis]OXM62254.1 TcmI family type II polyketide cyclase [Amycolatopsis sp. KNN50.9b]